LYLEAGRATLSGGLVVSNTAKTDGGGLYDHDGTLTLVNTTVSSNTAGSDGGGLYVNLGTTALTYTTIASNTASTGGGGIHNASGTVGVKNTIVAYNGPANCNAALTTHDHNLDSGNTCGFDADNDHPNTDPLLGPLADDGGDTLTHALLTDSPAIDAGACVPDVTTVDQRGLPRPDGGGCDIGAYEWIWQKVYLPLILRND
jgi:predicted outer membrane repeat protein